MQWKDLKRAIIPSQVEEIADGINALMSRWRFKAGIEPHTGAVALICALVTAAQEARLDPRDIHRWIDERWRSEMQKRRTN